MPAADLIVNGNNFVHTAIGLSGTAPGFTGASSFAIGSSGINMNVSSPNSTVIQWLTLGASGNTASSAYTVSANSPADSDKGGLPTGIDRVTIAQPASLAAGGRLFARLKVTVAEE